MPKYLELEPDVMSTENWRKLRGVVDQFNLDWMKSKLRHSAAPKAI